MEKIFMSEKDWAHDPARFDPMQAELSPDNLLPEFREEYRIALRICDVCNRVLEIGKLRLIETQQWRGVKCTECFEKGVINIGSK